VLDGYKKQIFSDGEPELDLKEGEPTEGAPPGEPPAGTPEPRRKNPPRCRPPRWDSSPGTPYQRRLGGHRRRLRFDSRLLTNNRPYFAAYVKPGDLARVTDRLELFQDEWGYLLLWATLAIACATALSLVILPVIFGWRTIFSHNPGKFRTIIYFACLGAGYIMVEVGLISDFILALSNATVSASILITGMLVFSGLGSFVSERYLDRARSIMPKIFIAIAAILFGYGLFLDRVLDFIGTFPYFVRLLFCFALIFRPPS